MERERLVEELCSSAEKLVVEHGMRHEEVAKAIRDYLLTKAEDLPKIPVLYNDCYGGFGLSQHFKQFRKGKGLEAYEAVLEYGRHLQKRFPEVYRILYLVEHLHLADGVVSSICTRVNTKNDLVWAQRQLQLLEGTKGSGSIDEMSAKQYYQSKAKHSNFNLAALSSTGLSCLEESLNKSMGHWPEQLTWLNKQQFANIPEVLRRDIASWADSNPQEQTGRQRSSEDALTGRQSLVQCLETTPHAWPKHRLFQDNDWALSISYARFLSASSDNDVHSIIDLKCKSAHEKTSWALGRRAASGEFAELNVKWVPQLVSYKVQDYDGLQEVSW